MSVLVVTGTGTGVGKTVVTAAIAAVAHADGSRVAVVKPAQTGVGPGEPGDCAEITRLSGVQDTHEPSRFPDPLAPGTAARVCGRSPADLRAAATLVSDLATDRDLVLVEGAGGLLVRFDEAGTTIADVARWLDAPVLLVTRPDLGTLNHTALTLEALDRRGLTAAGLVIGSWPSDPDLACTCNLEDLADLAGQNLAGALPAGAGALDRAHFLPVARSGLAPSLGGRFAATTLHPTPRPQEAP